MRPRSLWNVRVQVACRPALVVRESIRARRAARK